VLAILAFVALLLILFTITRPLERTVTDDIAYTQAGTFEYSATAPAGVYDAGALHTGDPIFRKLVNQIQVGFSYRATAELPHQLGGTYRLIAEVGASDGWQRAIELRPATTFAGDSFVARAPLDLAVVQALIDDQEQHTGIERREYTLALVPEVHLNGTLAGQPVSDRFAPRLIFRSDSLELQIKRDDAKVDPLAPTQPGTLKRSRTEPNTIALFGVGLGVVAARWLALALSILLIGGALALGRRLALAKLTDEPARIKGQYGPMLVAVHDSELAIADRVVEVATFDDLVRLAERDERMILYERSGAAHHYVVHIAGVNYHYCAVEVGEARAIAAKERTL
jgi:hypothetical protein